MLRKNKMLEMTTTRMLFALICIMGVSLVTAALPQPQTTPTAKVPKQDHWDILLSTIPLPDWMIREMSETPGLREKLKADMMARPWLMVPDQPKTRVKPDLPALWSHDGVEVRRSVVADDAAFRERSKLLTSMERKKWLNSYMQRLLVVN